MSAGNTGCDAPRNEPADSRVNAACPMTSRPSYGRLSFEFDNAISHSATSIEVGVHSVPVSPWGQGNLDSNQPAAHPPPFPSSTSTRASGHCVPSGRTPPSGRYGGSHPASSTDFTATGHRAYRRQCGSPHAHPRNPRNPCSVPPGVTRRLGLRRPTVVPSPHARVHHPPSPHREQQLARRPAIDSNQLNRHDRSFGPINRMDFS